MTLCDRSKLPVIRKPLTTKNEFDCGVRQIERKIICRRPHQQFEMAEHHGNRQQQPQQSEVVEIFLLPFFVGRLDGTHIIIYPRVFIETGLSMESACRTGSIRSTTAL